MNLNEILNTIDNMIRKMWDKKHEKERIELFNLREKVCKMIQESQHKNK